MRMNRNLNSGGFTLIELLVSLVIFLLVMTGVYTMFDNQQRTYLIQEETAQMQENLRASMLLISRDARMANAMINSLKGATLWDEADKSVKSLSGITAYDNFEGLGPDRIDIAYADFNCRANITTNMPYQSAIYKVDDNSDFELHDVILISNGDSSHILEITHLPGDNKIQHNPAGDTVSFANPPGSVKAKEFFWPDGGYSPGTLITKFLFRSYKISFADPDHPRLVMDRNGPLGGEQWEPIAENIEDMQIAYIMSDGNAYNSPAESGLPPGEIRAIRISIVARSNRPVPGDAHRSFRPALENHAAGIEDKYLRRVMTQTVKVRNMGLSG